MTFRNLRFLSVLILAGYLITAEQTAKAQVFDFAGEGVDIASSALLGRTAENIIQRAKDASNELLANAQQSGNTLLLRATDEINLSVENAVRLIGDDMQRTLSALSEDKRDALLGLARVVEAVDKLRYASYTLRDTIAFDTRSILGDLPFVAERLVIQRIEGLTQLQGSGNYTMNVFGSYVGLTGGAHTSSLALSIDGNQVKSLRVDPREIHLATLSIPAATLAPHFDDDTVAFVPATLSIRQEFAEPFLGFLWNRTRTKEYETKINLALYPSFAVRLKVKARHRLAGWKEISPRQTTMTHADHCRSSCDGHYGTVHGMSLKETGERSPPEIGDRRITGADCDFVSGVTGFDADKVVSVSKDKSIASCSIRFRTRPNTYRLTAQREQYDWIDEIDTELEVDVRFGAQTQVRVPKQSSLIEITGTLTTGDRVECLSDEACTDSIVSIVRRVENLNDVSLYIRFERPSDF